MTDNSNPTPTTEATPTAVTPSDADVPTPSAENPPANPGDNKPVPAEAAKPGQLLFEEKKEPDAEKTETKAEGEADKEGENQIEYKDFQLPKEYILDNERKQEFIDFAKGAKLTQEQAQMAIDLHLKALKQQDEIWEDTRKDWREEVMKHPEMGGKNWPAVQGAINDCMRQFTSSPEHFEHMRENLILLGLGDQPAFLEFMYNVAKATRGDSLAGKSDVTTTEKPSTAKILYPNMP